MKTDQQIRKDVQRELKWDTRTWRLNVNVEAADGVVTLTGVVPSYADRMAVQNAVHRVAGVLDVANDVVIHAERPFSDEEIARAVRQALQWDALVPDEQITSTVSDGWITLAGNVFTLSQRLDAERAVENLLGVKGVFNDINVEVRPADAQKLRQSITEALERRADREAQRLRIEVKDGEVELHGHVHSWQEREAVVGSIIPMVGVKKINDRLRIDPYF